MRWIGHHACVDRLVAGSSYACANPNQGMQCWGRNESGQLGDGSTIERPGPVKVQGLPDGAVVEMAAGDAHTCAIVNGAAFCWGRNNAGQLGNGSTSESHAPVPVQGLGSGVSKIAAGLDYTCAVVSGAAWCWGRNDFGQLGDGSTSERYAPAQISALSTEVKVIGAGYTHACALLGSGAWCWGRNDSGQLGNGSTTNSPVPVQVQGLTGPGTQIVAGLAHSCTGQWCWGSNSHGQLGDGSTTGSYVPVQVMANGSFGDVVASGHSFACGFWADPHGYPPWPPRPYCWGANASGQLGDGTTADKPAPVFVGFPEVFHAIDTLAAGQTFRCEIVEAFGAMLSRDSSDTSVSCFGQLDSPVFVY